MARAFSWRRALLSTALRPGPRVDHLSAAEKRAYVLADNKLAQNAGWDEELLALELKELVAAVGAGFPLRAIEVFAQSTIC